MRTAETTNGLLAMVMRDVDLLIGWADADAEHAAENDAPETSADDRRRARALRRAKKLLEQCQR